MTNLIEGRYDILYINNISPLSPQWVSGALRPCGFYPSAPGAVRVLDKLITYDSFPYLFFINLVFNHNLGLLRYYLRLLAVRATSSSLLARIYAIRLTFQFIKQILEWAHFRQI